MEVINLATGITIKYRPRKELAGNSLVLKVTKKTINR